MSGEWKCVFCENSGIIIFFSEQTLEKCRNILKLRQKHNLKYKDVILPDVGGTSNGYHRECYKAFTALMRKYYEAEKDANNEMLLKPSTSTTSGKSSVSPANTSSKIPNLTQRLAEQEEASTSLEHIQGIRIFDSILEDIGIGKSDRTANMESHGMRILQKKRTTNFREDETKLLIQLWGSPQIQNKLYLTHRKAPVMRLLAANMQHRGFYRTPDEIKTRIRNLKCLYHRIKRSMQTGVGIGTVDPDWTHFKAMDEILTRRTHKNLYKDNVFEGPRCEDIKQEIIDDIDINDDMESFTTNSMNESDNEFEEEPRPIQTITPKPLSALQNTPKKDNNYEKVKIAPKPNMPQPKVLQNQLQIPIQANLRGNNGNGPTIPFPLLILNGLPNAVNSSQNKGLLDITSSGNTNSNNLDKPKSATSSSDTTTCLLTNLLEVQKEHLQVEKQRLKLDKQKFKLNQLVSTQMLMMLPSLRNYLQKLSTTPSPADNDRDDEEEEAEEDEEHTSPRRKRQRPNEPINNDLSDGKILKSVLEEGIKKYMLESMNESDENDDEDDDDEDSGIHNVNDDSEKK